MIAQVGQTFHYIIYFCDMSKKVKALLIFCFALCFYFCIDLPVNSVSKPSKNTMVQLEAVSDSCPKYPMPLPVRRFLYHALHKTASSQIRKILSEYCRNESLRCFIPSVLCYPREKLWNCMKSLEHYIEFGTYTPARIQKCCPKAKNVTKFEGLADHMIFGHADSREYVKNMFPADAFRFALIRNPVDQFVSYYHQIKVNIVSQIIVCRKSAKAFLNPP